MTTREARRGIEGQQAPAWNIPTWIGADGEPLETPLQLSDYEGKVLVMLAFQSWCPGCHSSGFPTMQALTEEFEGNDDVAFLAIQTVFEGHEANTADQLLKNQQQYDLKIPFGHDVGDSSTNGSPSIMYHYRTQGTPWVVIIDRDGTVRYNDFHVNPDGAKEFIRELAK